MMMTSSSSSSLSTRRTCSKPSAYLRRGVYAECTLATATLQKRWLTKQLKNKSQLLVPRPPTIYTPGGLSRVIASSKYLTIKICPSLRVCMHEMYKTQWYNFTLQCKLSHVFFEIFLRAAHSNNLHFFLWPVLSDNTDLNLWALKLNIVRSTGF